MGEISCRKSSRAHTPVRKRSTVSSRFLVARVNRRESGRDQTMALSRTDRGGEARKERVRSILVCLTVCVRTSLQFLPLLRSKTCKSKLVWVDAGTSRLTRRRPPKEGTVHYHLQLVESGASTWILSFLSGHDSTLVKIGHLGAGALAAQIHIFQSVSASPPVRQHP